MKDLSFEEAMSKLEKITEELENGKLSLDDSINKFDEGMKLSKHLNEILENAEKKITVLTEQDDGTILEENFDNLNEE